MGTGYYPQFDLIRIDASGFRVSLPSTTISVYNVTQAASLGTIASDANGIILEGSFTGGSVSVGDTVEFSHATYPETARCILQATQEDAYRAVENDLATFVVENLYTSTTNARLIDLYARDADNPNVAISLIGGGKSGTTAYIAYPQTPVAKNLEIFPIALDENLNFAGLNFNTTNFEAIEIPAATNRLFAHTANATTSGTSTEDLYNDSIPGNTLGQDQDLIEVEYAGSYASNGNDKYLNLHFGGTDFFGIGPVTQNGGTWYLRGSIIRVSSTVVRTNALYTNSSGTVASNYLEITGLTLSGANNMKLTGRTTAAAGDLTARMGEGVLRPAT